MQDNSNENQDQAVVGRLQDKLNELRQDVGVKQPLPSAPSISRPQPAQQPIEEKKEEEHLIYQDEQKKVEAVPVQPMGVKTDQQTTGQIETLETEKASPASTPQPIPDSSAGDKMLRIGLTFLAAAIVIAVVRILITSDIKLPFKLL